MLAVFMGLSAIAADIGRFYVVAGELQTAADAAALKGAATLQLLTGSYESTVDADVIQFAATTNRSDGDSLNIPAGDIDVGYWTPGANGVDGTFVTPTPVGLRPNAVSVKASGAPRGVFAQMIGRTTGLPLTRRAIAWVANVSLSCTRPWALNYLPLVRKVNGNSDTTQSLDMTKFLDYQNTPDSNRTMVMRNSEIAATGLPADDGVWTAYNLPSQSNGGANSGSTTYQSQIADCSHIALSSDAGNGNIQPSTGKGKCGAGTVVCWALEAIPGMSQGQINGPGICGTFQTNDATCYDQQSGAAGVVVDIAFANVVGNGSGGIDFKYVGETTLLCVFQSTTDVCPGMPAGRAKSGYAPGTLAVITSGLKSRTLNPQEDFLSNAPSNVQRLILVK